MRVAVDLADGVEMLAVIDHQRGADRLPALRAARAARQHRHADLAADVDDRAHVVVGCAERGRRRGRPGRSTRRSSSGRAQRRSNSTSPRDGRAQARGEIRTSPRLPWMTSGGATAHSRSRDAQVEAHDAARALRSTASPLLLQMGAQRSRRGTARRVPRARPPCARCSCAARSHFSRSKLERKRRFWMRRLSVRYDLRQQCDCARARLMRWWIARLQPVIARKIAARMAREHLEGQRLDLARSRRP